MRYRTLFILITCVGLILLTINWTGLTRIVNSMNRRTLLLIPPGYRGELLVFECTDSEPDAVSDNGTQLFRFRPDGRISVPSLNLFFETGRLQPAYDTTPPTSIPINSADSPVSLWLVSEGRTAGSADTLTVIIGSQEEYRQFLKERDRRHTRDLWRPADSPGPSNSASSIPATGDAPTSQPTPKR